MAVPKRLETKTVDSKGRLMLDKGVAPDGTRLLGEDYVGMLTAESARSPDVGLLWWRNAAWERYTLKDDAVAFLTGSFSIRNRGY